jgi:hypothetical protein
MQIRSDSWIPDPCVRLFAQISATIVLISMQYQRYFLFLVWNLAANTSRSAHILNTPKIKKPKSVKTWASKYLYNNIVIMPSICAIVPQPCALAVRPGISIEQHFTLQGQTKQKPPDQGPKPFVMPPIVHAFLALRAAIRMV